MNGKFRKGDKVICFSTNFSVSQNLSDKIESDIVMAATRPSVNDTLTVDEVHGEFINFTKHNTVSARQWFHQSRFMFTDEPRKDVFFGDYSGNYSHPSTKIPVDPRTVKIDPNQLIKSSPRIIREGCTLFCDKCHSSMDKDSYFGRVKCINPVCDGDKDQKYER